MVSKTYSVVENPFVSSFSVEFIIKFCFYFVYYTYKNRRKNMDVAAVGLKLENDFPRRIEVYEVKQRILRINNENRPVLDIDCYLIPRSGETSYKNFILPIKIDLECMCVPYDEYENAVNEILEYLE
jgi:hypothetical protein